MNDSTELLYTYSLTGEIIAEMKDKEQNEIVQYFLESFGNYILEKQSL